MVTILCQLIVHSASFPDVDPLPFEMSNDITAAEAELHNQVLRNRLSLQEMRTSMDGWTSPLASSFAPQLLEAQRGNPPPALPAEMALQLATRQLQEALARAQRESGFRQQQVPTFSSQYGAYSESSLRALGAASERLAAQRAPVFAQLEQTGREANMAFNGLGRASSGAMPPLVALQQSEEVVNPRANQAKEPLSFTQTFKQKNPALAALLLEPALYGYSLITWLLLMAVTGISSAFCLLRGGKLPMGYAAYQALPSDAEAGKGQQREAAQNGAPNMSTSPFVVYSGRYGSLQQYESEEEQEGMEYWTRVPTAEQIPHPRTNGHKSSCGYIDEP